jgi:hypothetical protein
MGGGGGDFIYALAPKKMKKRKFVRNFRGVPGTLNRRSQAANDIGEGETVVVKRGQRPHKDKATNGLLELEQLRHGGPHDVLLYVKRQFLRIRDTFSADPCLLLIDPDPDHPAIFVIDLQDSNKKLFFSLIFSAYYFLKVHLHHYSKKKFITNSKNSRNQIKVFVINYA